MHFLYSLFASVFSLVGLVVTVGGMMLAFGAARSYVRSRLRYVDAVRNPIAPWIAAIVATLILTPVVAILGIVHLVGLGTALLVGGATGLGTASGVKALKRGE